MALYVYGMMRAGEASRAASAHTGKPPLSAVAHGGVGALVSELPEGEVTIRRDSVLGHADVLQAAFQHGPVLPLRFGSVVPDAEDVIQGLIAPRSDQLAARLDALEGKAEMQLRVVYLEEPLMRSILNADRGLAAAVGQMQGRPAEATHFERIRVGEAIAAAVQARRLADAARFMESLSPHAVASSLSEPHHERTALNAAFLVERARLDDFDAAVEGLSEAHGAEAQFKLIGPMPAYSFADQEWERAGEVAARWA